MLAAEGAQLAISARRTDNLRTLAKEITGAGGKPPLVVPADLTDDNGPAALAETVLADLGRGRVGRPRRPAHPSSSTGQITQRAHGIGKSLPLEEGVNAALSVRAPALVVAHRREASRHSRRPQPAGEGAVLGQASGCGDVREATSAFHLNCRLCRVFPEVPDRGRVGPIRLR